jgi:APA family basic amino acid/polyamine antiporter
VTATALAAVALVTALVLAGLRRTSLVNGVLVAVTVTALAAGAAAMGLAAATDPGGARGRLGGLAAAPDPMTLLHASAIAFVAFTGFGRVATLGEEVREPGRTIPRAVVATLAVGGLLALVIVLAGIAAVGPAVFAGAATDDAASRNAVLARVVGDLGAAGRLPASVASPVRWLLVAGAVTAMLGVLLNLVLGLSRVALAMGRDRCLPGRLGGTGRGGEPTAAVLAVAGVVAALVLVGDVSLTWTFSAVTVLAYYGLTNLCALRLPRSPRAVLRVAPWAGLAGCATLAAAVPPVAWGAALAALAVGFALRAACGGGSSGAGEAGDGGPLGSPES